MRTWHSGFGVAVLSMGAIAAGYFGGKPLLDRVEFAQAEAQVQASRQELATIQDMSTVFRHVGKVVEPSVVEIIIHKSVQAHANSPEEDLMRRFFRDREMPQDPDQGNSQSYEQIDKGSGVIMEAADGYGYILTNNHVAGDATEMDIVLADGRTIRNGKTLGADPKSDLAVVQIKADRLIPAKWGNSDELEKGDWVMAFGCPLGYIGSMTHGIVSALNRTDVPILPQDGYGNFIQVDAPINPGNSGGPLVNIHGEVVGINTAIATRSGMFEGIGFAIPSNQAKEVFYALKSHGKVVRGWLGIEIENVGAQDMGLAKSFNFNGTGGVLVTQVFPGTPAYGKLEHGDIIVGLNGKTIETNQQLRNLVADTAPGSQLTVKFLRNGKEQSAELVVGDQPADMMAFAGYGGPGAGEAGRELMPSVNTKWGLSLRSVDADTARRLGIADLKDGALITSVAPNSLADRVGLKEAEGQEVIVEVGNTKIHNARDAEEALSNANPKDGVRLYVATPQGSTFVFLQGDDQGN
jgi:serine protease Do